jgi:hypothetical protein
MWGRGAVAVRKVDGCFELFVDESKFDGVIGAVEYLLKHRNDYKAMRFPDRAREFMRALTSFDYFWNEVRAQVMEIRPPRRVLGGAMAVKKEDGLLS